MSENKRSFFATIPGVVTGLAGLLTAVVGLITLLVQLDVIGGESSGTPSVVTAPAAGGGAGTATTPSTVEPGRFTVSPASLKLQPTEREKSITVQNATKATQITVLTPEFSGADRSVFKTDAGCTNVRLEPGRSCTLKVLFSPSGALRNYSANLVLKAEGVPAATEVPIDASAIL